MTARRRNWPPVDGPVDRGPSLVPPEKGPIPGASIPEVTQRVPAACGLGCCCRNETCVRTGQREALNTTLGAQASPRPAGGRRHAAAVDACAPSQRPDPSTSLSSVGLTPSSNKHLLSARLSSRCGEPAPGSQGLRGGCHETQRASVAARTPGQGHAWPEGRPAPGLHHRLRRPPWGERGRAGPRAAAGGEPRAGGPRPAVLSPEHVVFGHSLLQKRPLPPQVR